MHTTEEEVLRHIEGKLNLPPSKEYLAREIGNILRASMGMPPSLVRWQAR